jgi:hypothetical protein
MLAIDVGHDRSGIARLVGCRCPQRLAGRGIERHDTSRLAAHVHEHAIRIDEGRGGDTEVSLRRVEGLPRIHAPQHLPGREVDAVQHAVGAVREDAASGNHRRGARPFIESEIVSIPGGVVEDPDGLAGECRHRFHGLAIVDAMEEHQPVTNDRGARKSGADIALPEKWWSGSRKGWNDLRTRVDAVSIRSEDLRPVGLRILRHQHVRSNNQTKKHGSTETQKPSFNLA